MPPEIVLNPDQQNAHDQLLIFATTDDHSWPYASFTGYAGTGKTTTLTQLIYKLNPKQCSIGVAAPTHKAVKVIKQTKIDFVEYRTIHSWLKLKETIDLDTGAISYVEDTFRKDEQPPIADLDILIVDESSMLSQDLFVRISNWIKRNKLRVIFTGDPTQIPPVKEQFSIPFLKAKEWNALSVELNQIMRQKAGNPILEFATAVRTNLTDTRIRPVEHVISDQQQPAIASEEWTGIYLLEHGSIEEQQILEYYFNSPAFGQSADYMKIIAWRNATVRQYNNRVRSILYKSITHLPNYVEGEKLMMSDPYPLSAREMLSRNEELEVLKLGTGVRRFTYVDKLGQLAAEHFNCYEATIKYWYNGNEKIANIPIVHDSALSAYKELQEKLANLAKISGPEERRTHWKNFYKLKELFANVTYNYAITGHKSQGSTYDQCLILKWDIDLNPNIEERNKILYVAGTRPRHRLFIEP